MNEIKSHTDADGWRWYGDKVSVTTILSNAVANPKLAAWYKKNSENKINKVKSETADFGTQAHEMFEKVMLAKHGDVFEYPPTLLKHIEGFIKWKTEHNVKALHTELNLVSEEHGFAGTVDFIGEIDGKVCVADWKTGTRWSITNGWQMSAYRRMAIEAGLVDESCGLYGLQVNRETAEVKAFKYEHLDFVELAFMSSLQVFKSLYFNKLQKLEWKWLQKRSVYYSPLTYEGVPWIWDKQT